MGRPPEATQAGHDAGKRSGPRSGWRRYGQDRSGHASCKVPRRTVFTGKEDRVLVSTFTKNLATDIFENLRKICAAEAMARIEVVNLDAWVSHFLRTQGYRHQVVFDDEGNECWRNALNLVPGELALPENFYRTEWEDVIQAQNITSAEQYVKAARLGRGTRLGRDLKKRIWPVFQEYRAQMNEQGKKEYIDLIRDARSLLETRKITLFDSEMGSPILVGFCRAGWQYDTGFDGLHHDEGAHQN